MSMVSDRVRKSRRRLWASVVAVWVFVGLPLVLSCALAGKKVQTRTGLADGADWPHEISDLRPDETMTFGRLDNGLRYIVRQNQTPKDRVSMHLYVRVGSLFERDDEKGIAHFLEHMLFNGSKNFPPGEMIKYFQRIGMQFGPDANAHTGFDETVYDVLLPKGDKQSLAEGLLVLRDYADGALLLPEEVARERKVILAEKRSRDSAHFRTLKATFRFEMPGLILGDRFPIGETETIEQIDHRMLRDFYESWYRPERMFLIVVGDVDKKTARAMIEKRFADMTPKRAPRKVPHIGQMAHEGIKSFYHHEEDAGATSVSIETIVLKMEPEDTAPYQRQQLLEDMAHDMMQKRLDGLVRKETGALTSAGIGGGYYLRQLRYAEISSHTDPEKWPKASALMDQALRKALEFGFTSSEFERAREAAKAGLLKLKREEGTRDSKTLARQIMAGIRHWHVLQSPTQRAELLIPELDAITLDQVNEAFRRMWSADHRLVLVTGNVQISDGSKSPEKQIKDTYLASRSTAVAPPEEKQAAAFPYLPAPATGEIKSREEVPDLGITRIVFTNGIRLLLKPTAFKKDEVLANLSFGYGQASEPEDQAGLAKLTESVVNESGFGTIDRTTLDEVLAGRLANADLDIREDRFVVKGDAATKELPLLFQLMQAFILDPGFREEARQLALKRFEQEYERLSKSVDGVMQLEGQRLLAGGDYRFGMPALGQLQKRTLAQIKAWVNPQLRAAPMEMAIVGDFDVQRTIDLAARYIGSLPERGGAAMSLPVAGPDFPEGKTWSFPVRTETPKALVVVAYPTEDFWDIRRTRRLSVLAELYNEKLRQRIRENLGAAYSPYAYNRSYRAYKGYGMTQIFVQVEPSKAPAIVKEVRQIAEQLSQSISDTDEFRRVLDPTLTYIKDLRQKNSYWLNSVLTGAARHPEQLDWARTFETDYAAVQMDEIAALARKYLVNERAAAIILTPQ